MNNSELAYVDKIIQTKMGLSTVKKILIGFAEYLENKEEKFDSETRELKSVLTNELSSSVLSFMPFVENEGVEAEDIPKPIREYFDRLYLYIKKAPDEQNKQKRIQSCLHLLKNDLLERVRQQCKVTLENTKELKKAEAERLEEKAYQAFLKKMQENEKRKQGYLTYRQPGGRGEYNLLDLSFAGLDDVKMRFIQIATGLKFDELTTLVNKLNVAINSYNYDQIEKNSEKIKDILDEIGVVA